MRVFEKISKVLMWIFMIFYLFFNILTIGALVSRNESIVSAGRVEEVISVVPIAISLGLMLVSCVLYSIPKLKKLRPIWIGIAIIASIVMLATALDLGRMLPVQITASGDKGLTTWKLIWRHIGISGVAIFMVFAFIFGRFADKQDILREASMVSRYNFSDAKIFADSDENINKDTKKHREKSANKQI